VPQDRLRSPRAGHGRKTTSLTHLEYRVWDQFQLSADDFGVMRYSHLPIQNDNEALAQCDSHEIIGALERLVSVGLAVRFEHQDRAFICDPTWQTFQHVEYPRVTLMPKPSPEAFGACDDLTQKLFVKHPGGLPKRSPKDSQSPPEDSPTTRARVARETANANANANANGKRLAANANGTGDGPASDTPEAEQFVAFWERYPRKDARKAALGEWVRQKLDAVAEAVLTGLERALTSRQWREAMREPDMPHIPHARTWLHQRRWEDEVTPAFGASGPRLSEDVRRLCEAAGIPLHAQITWFESAVITRDDHDAVITLVITDEDARAWVIRHFRDQLETAARATGDQLVISDQEAA
jgi:hypothetical protein